MAELVEYAVVAVSAANDVVMPSEQSPRPLRLRQRQLAEKLPVLFGSDADVQPADYGLVVK